MKCFLPKPRGGGEQDVTERTSEIIAQIAGLNLPNDVLRKEISKASPAVIKTLKESWSSKKSSKSYSDTPPYIALAQYSAEEKRLKELRAVFASEEAIREKYLEPLKKSMENTLILMDDYTKNPPQTSEEKEKRLEGITNSTTQTAKEAAIAYNDAQAVIKDPKASPEEKQKALGLASTAVISCAAIMNKAIATGNENVRNAVRTGLGGVHMSPEMLKEIKESLDIGSTARKAGERLRKNFNGSNVFKKAVNPAIPRKGTRLSDDNLPKGSGKKTTAPVSDPPKDQDKTRNSIGSREIISSIANDAIAQAQKIYRDAKLSLEKPNDSNDGMTTNMFGTAKGIDAQPAETSSGLNQLLASAQDSSSQSKGADENDVATDINSPRTPSSVKNQLAQHAHKEDETAIYGYNMFNQVERSA